MLTLVCAPCGKSVSLEGPDVRFGIDLLSAAAAAEWIGLYDHRYHCVVVFCCEDCMDAAISRRGYIMKNLGAGKRMEAA